MRSDDAQAVGPQVAVVLAGGEGRRMGGQKALRRWGRTTLVGQALALARGYAPHVALAVRDDTQIAGAVDVVELIDDPRIPGPLSGVASALRFAGGQGADAALVLPCDAPRLPIDLGQRLHRALEPPARVAVAASGGRLHPVCALWRVDVLADLERYVASSRASLTGLAREVGMATVEWPVGDADPFVNINTLDDLAIAQAESRTLGG